MKSLIAALAMAFAGSAIAVDLDRPGALEALQRDNPAHFTKVEKILSDAPRMPYGSISGWIRTEFNAKGVNTSHLLKTTYPAQARLTFTLDHVEYSKTIFIDAPATAVPAR
jgi:hypothetical protein